MTRIWARLRERPFLTIAVLAVALRLPTFTTRLFDVDEAAIGVQGMVVRSGGTMYVDIFDRKPPLPPLAYGASFALTDSTDIRPMRVLVTLFLLAGGLLVAHDAKRRWGSNIHALWGGALFVGGAMALYPADAGAANYAHFALLPGTAALLWSRRDRLGWAFAAGIAFGLALLTRQSWLLTLPAAMYSAWCSGRIRHIALLLSGTALTVSTVALYAPFDAYWEWNFTNSPGFVFAAIGIGTAIFRGVTSSAGFIAFHVTAGACLWVLLRRRNPLRTADRDLWFWLLGGLAAVAAGFRFFGHYWLQVLPPLVVLATPVAVEFAGRARRLAVAGLVVPGVVAFALLFVPGSFHDRPDPTEPAAFLVANTTPDQRIFVWGSYPDLLLRADRLPAGSLVHTDFVTGRSGGRSDPEVTLSMATSGAFELMLGDLRERPPELVLDTSSADNLGYSKYPLSLFPELESFVTDGYERVDEIDGVTVWRRKA